VFQVSVREVCVSTFIQFVWCVVCGVWVLLNKNVMLYVCRVVINLS
jgi:hypothetical protein